MHKRRFKLNHGKSKIITDRGMNASTVVDGVNLIPVDSVRNLGIIFEFYEAYQFTDQIVIITREMLLFFQCLDSSSVITIFLLRIDFCNLLYDHFPGYLLRRLQFVINKADQIIFTFPPQTPTMPFLLELNWLSVTARIQFELLLTYKILKFGDPKYLAEVFQPVT